MMKNKKFYGFILILLIILALVVSSIIIFNYISNIQNKKQMEKISDDFLNEDNSIQKAEKITYLENTIDNNTNKGRTADLESAGNQRKIKGYQIIGIIRIPKINLKYPILEINNEESMKISITKFWGDNVNDFGNLTLAGHNNLDGTMFGKLKKLELEDEIKLTDLNKTTQSYKIYDIYITSPDDTSIVNEDTSKKEVTLITCSNGRKNRLIIKAENI